MLDARQAKRDSRVSQDSENECEGRRSLEAAAVSDCSRSPPRPVDSNPRPLEKHDYNASDPLPLPPQSRVPTLATNATSATSLLKPPTAPGVSRFGFKPPPGTSLSPRRPGTDSDSQGSDVVARVASVILSPAKSTTSSAGADGEARRPVGKVGSTRSRTGGAPAGGGSAASSPSTTARDTVSSRTRRAAAKSAAASQASTGRTTPTVGTGSASRRNGHSSTVRNVAVRWYVCARLAHCDRCGRQ